MKKRKNLREEYTCRRFRRGIPVRSDCECGSWSSRLLARRALGRSSQSHCQILDDYENHIHVTVNKHACMRTCKRRNKMSYLAHYPVLGISSFEIMHLNFSGKHRVTVQLLRDYSFTFWRTSTAVRCQVHIYTAE